MCIRLIGNARKYRLLGSFPEFLIQDLWGGVRKCAFLTNSRWCWCSRSRDLAVRTTDTCICWKAFCVIQLWLCYLFTLLPKIKHLPEEEEDRGVTEHLLCAWLSSGFFTFFTFSLNLPYWFPLSTQHAQNPSFQEMENFPKANNWQVAELDLDLGVPDRKDSLPQEDFKTLNTAVSNFQISVLTNHKKTP